MVDYSAWYDAMKKDINRVNKAIGVEVNKVESILSKKVEVLGYELEIGNSSILLFKDRYLELHDARSMASSIFYSDIYENSFDRYCTINCRITKVNLTEDKVTALTPIPSVKRRK